MNLSKKRKALLLLWTFMTSLLLSTSTYAWFSTNRILGFQSFNIHIASLGGIEISADSVDWKGVLTLVDLMEARNNYPNSRNQIPSTIQPVSSAGDVEAGRLKMYFGETFKNSSNETLLYAVRNIENEGFGIESNGKFVAFDLFLKNNSIQTLYLTDESYINQKEGVNSGIENAFRVAFLNLGNTSSESSRNVVQSLNRTNGTVIWEPNYDVHKKSAVDHARDMYDIITTETRASRLRYSGIYNEIQKSANVGVSTTNNHPNYFKRVEPSIVTRKNFSGNREITSLPPGINKIRVYIWIEGQDVDCEDNSQTGEVLINLNLSTNPM